MGNPAMTSKDRMMLALRREKPDRLPVSVHQWQTYPSRDVHGRHERSRSVPDGRDGRPDPVFRVHGPVLADGRRFHEAQHGQPGGTTRRSSAPIPTTASSTIPSTRPAAMLTYKTEGDRKTTWITEYLIKRDEDIHLIDKYMPVPRLDSSAVAKAYDAVGDGGILRGFVWGDQAGCWQHAACLYDINALILATFDKPDWVHAFLSDPARKETPVHRGDEGREVRPGRDGRRLGLLDAHLAQAPREFCLPYDRVMHDALHDLGFTDHLSHLRRDARHRGDDRRERRRRLRDARPASASAATRSRGSSSERSAGRLALIGGIDQFNTLTRGTKDDIRAGRARSYSRPSAATADTSAPPRTISSRRRSKNLTAMADAARECVY